MDAPNVLLCPVLLLTFTLPARTSTGVLGGDLANKISNEYDSSRRSTAMKAGNKWMHAQLAASFLTAAMGVFSNNG